MSKMKGFSLIELMIVIAIIGILGAIAYPQYSQYVTQARRNDGIATLLLIMQKQERFFTEELAYTTALGADTPTEKGLGYTVDGDGKASSENDHYLISAAICAGDTIDRCVTLTAEPQGIQAGDGNMTLDSRGNRTPATHWQ